MANGPLSWLDADSWRGYDGEKDMTDNDWTKRGIEQALAMREGGSAEFSNPDKDGIPTQGCYNGDYTDEYHEECLRKLKEDEYYEAEAEQDIKALYRVHKDS